MADVCRAEHIAIGTEILLGQIFNTHARSVSSEFAKYGLFLYYHGAVGDNLARIVEYLKIASARSNVVVLTGGLGPTVDDLTREAVAEHIGVDLALDPLAVKVLEQWFANRSRAMPQENLRQAMLIRGASWLDNPNGTAPGQYVESGGVHYFLLPGPPLEMEPMLRTHVIPRLLSTFGDERVVRSRVLHFCGVGESEVDERVTDLTEGANPTVAPLASEGEMMLRITASARTEEDAEQLIAPVAEELARRFPEYIYGTDDETLHSVVGKELLRLSRTLSAAESCTGGQISTMLTSVPGSSRYFLGSVVAYDNLVKREVLSVVPEVLEKHGAVSEETARAMAEGVRKLCKTDYAVSVTGVAGPDGGTPQKPVGLVYGAIASEDGTVVFRMMHKGSRQQIQLRSAKYVLWRLWCLLHEERE